MKCPDCGNNVSRSSDSCAACGKDTSTFIASLRENKIRGLEGILVRIEASNAERQKRLWRLDIVLLFLLGGVAFIVAIAAALQNCAVLLLLLVLPLAGWILRLRLDEVMD